MVEVSWKPRAFLLKNFLTEEEVTHLVSKVPPRCAGLPPCGARLPSARGASLSRGRG